MEFQSTHPERGATVLSIRGNIVYRVSIHAPRAGCDLTATGFGVVSNQFQSTHPERGATDVGRLAASTSSCFNPRTPSGVRPLTNSLLFIAIVCFNPRTPSGVRQYKKERAESQGNMWYVLRTYWYGFPLNKLSDFSFKLSS